MSPVHFTVTRRQPNSLESLRSTRQEKDMAIRSNIKRFNVKAILVKDANNERKKYLLRLGIQLRSIRKKYWSYKDMSSVHFTVSRRQSNSVESLRFTRQEKNVLIQSYIKRFNVKVILVKSTNNERKKYLLSLETQLGSTCKKYWNLDP